MLLNSLIFIIIYTLYVFTPLWYIPKYIIKETRHYVKGRFSEDAYETIITVIVLASLLLLVWLLYIFELQNILFIICIVNLYILIFKLMWRDLDE